MGIPNIGLRGSIYWWRRKVTVAGRPFSLALSLHTGFFHLARVRAAHLSAELEKLRMAYGERGIEIDPATLKKVFTDALKWQLERILVDQTASAADPRHHAQVNRAYAEMWQIFCRADPRWTAEDDERLAKAGWTQDERLLVADLWEKHRHGPLVSSRQLDIYRDRFGFEPTASNLDRVRRTVLAARGAACNEAIKHLGRHPGDLDAWTVDALADDAPFAFEAAREEAATDGHHAAKAPFTNGTSKSSVESVAPAQRSTKPKKLLKDAARECIRAHLAHDAWSPDTVEQVGTAIRLFDFACGGDVMIDDLEQRHVTDFYALCAKLPNRWGKTRDEIERGLPASLEYGEKLTKAGKGHRLGFGTATLSKHMTWIKAVLDYADDSGSADGHRPANPLLLKTARSKIGDKKHKRQKRARDRRANWTRREVQRLLMAPIWSGCYNIDARFSSGQEIIHDAWYWLPLMYVLYGGRSSELAGLGLKEVFEIDEIPYFKVDYTDLRALKNVQSIRKLPIHPELIRLGFVEYVTAMREAGHSQLFPEMYSPKSKSFATTFYKSIFTKWRAWAFPEGTEWRHENRGVIKDKDVHSFRGVALNLMKGKVPDSVRVDILGHEGDGTTEQVYDEEAELADKLNALTLLSPLTAHIFAAPLRLRPADRQKFGARRGRLPQVK